MADQILFGRYRLVERVGSGGTAEVWRAVDQRTGDEVAVKRLHPIVFGSDAGRLRLVREFRALRALRHPGVVRVRDLEMTRDEAALVLDYVAGPSLRDRLAAGARFEPDEAVTIAGQVAAALDAAHSAGIVHRDVNPANLLLDGNGHARLTDFGIAQEGADQTAVTVTGTLVGTLRYVAPEQLRGEPATTASDVFGLAAVTYELLAGRPAFDVATPVALVEAQRVGPAPLERVGPAVDRAVRAGLATDPADRPSSAGAFVSGVRDALRTTSVIATEPSAAIARPAGSAPRGEARRRTGGLVVAGALGLAALVLAAALAEPTDRDGGGVLADPSPATTVAPEVTAAPAGDEADGGRGRGQDWDDKDDTDDDKPDKPDKPDKDDDKPDKPGKGEDGGDGGRG